MSTTIHLQVEGAEIILFDVRNREPNCIAVLDAAAALELAGRLKSAARKVLKPVTPEELPAVCVGEVWADHDPRSHEHGQRYRVAELVTTERGFQFAEVDELTTGFRSRIPLRGFRTLEKE